MRLQEDHAVNSAFFVVAFEGAYSPRIPLRVETIATDNATRFVATSELTNMPPEKMVSFLAYIEEAMI